MGQRRGDGIMIAACGVAQVVADRREAPLGANRACFAVCAELERNYQAARPD